MKSKILGTNCLEPCLCDTCLEARGDELLRFKNSELQSIAEEVEGEMELHTHSSIPSHSADLVEGCIICLKNNTFVRAIDIIKKRFKK
jgi:hypothetical protein